MRNNCGNCIRQGRSRLKHLESHVVSIRDCLYSVYLIDFIHLLLQTARRRIFGISVIPQVFYVYIDVDCFLLK